LAASAEVEQRRDALVERLFHATLGAMDVFAVYLGDRLGLYRALAEGGPLTSAGLAAATGTHERYAREWLEQQAVAGVLDVDRVDAAPHARRYGLDGAHARVLADADDPSHVAPFAHMIAGIGGVLPRVADAYRTGGGVPYEAYGRAFRHGQGHINRPAFTHELPADWLAAMPDVVDRLQDGGARVADLGCGQGWSSLAVARAFRHARIDGIDLDPASIADATRHAESAGVADRVRFLHADAAELVAPREQQAEGAHRQSREQSTRDDPRDARGGTTRQVQGGPP
jgi:Methyltransferase domain